MNECVLTLRPLMSLGGEILTPVLFGNGEVAQPHLKGDSDRRRGFSVTEIPATIL